MQTRPCEFVDGDKERTQIPDLEFQTLKWKVGCDSDK